MNFSKDEEDSSHGGRGGDVFTVIGPITGIDQNWGGTVGTPTGSIKIIESACSAQFLTPD